MDTNMINRIYMEKIPDEFTGDLDRDIVHIRELYTMIDPDTLLEPSRRKLERILFRLYQYKYFVLGRTQQQDHMQFWLDDAYYERIMTEVNALQDPDAMDAHMKQALHLIREQDYAGAGVYFKEAALCGSPDGQYDYALTLSNGEGCEADPLEGAFWYWLSARNGYHKAMYNLGVAYRFGKGVGASLTQMMYWYAMAARTLQNPMAVHSLGLSLRDQEIFRGNQVIGRNMMLAADNMGDNGPYDEYILRIADQIIDNLKSRAYNI